MQVEPDDALVVAVVLPLLWPVAPAAVLLVWAAWPLTGLNRAMAEHPMALQEMDLSLQVETPLIEVPPV
jgi:hypothetical protein